MLGLLLDISVSGLAQIWFYPGFLFCFWSYKSVFLSHHLEKFSHLKQLAFKRNIEHFFKHFFRFCMDGTTTGFFDLYDHKEDAENAKSRCGTTCFWLVTLCECNKKHTSTSRGVLKFFRTFRLFLCQAKILAVPHILELRCTCFRSHKTHCFRDIFLPNPSAKHSKI